MLGGGGWSWVHGLVIPIDIYIYNANDIRRIFNLLSIYIGLKLSMKNSNFFYFCSNLTL